MRTRLLASLCAALMLTTAPAPAQADEVRLEFQGRLDVFNTFGLTGVTFPLGGGGVFGVLNVDVAMVPLVTIGARILSGDLFLGLGVGYASSTSSDCADVSNGGCSERETTTSSTSWSISPMVNYELVNTEHAGFYLAVWFNLGTYGDSTSTTVQRGQPTVTVETDSNFWWGVDIGIGVRAKVTPALSLGTEWGWGMAGAGTGDNDSEDSFLLHGFWGTLNLSASIGL